MHPDEPGKSSCVESICGRALQLPSVWLFFFSPLLFARTFTVNCSSKSAQHEQGQAELARLCARLWLSSDTAARHLATTWVVARGAAPRRRCGRRRSPWFFFWRFGQISGGKFLVFKDRNDEIEEFEDKIWSDSPYLSRQEIRIDVWKCIKTILIG